MEKVMRSLVFPRVKSCYARALASEKQEGRLVMRLRVEASGRVSGADVKESQGLSAGIAKCAQEAALATRFPCTAAGGTIDVPFNFTLDASAP
jgi:outer membrane biosynthesis protein TonB